MNKVVELFGLSVSDESIDWGETVQAQTCAFSGRRCYKVRKSQPDISIGTCSVRYGRSDDIIVICPTRLTQTGRIFVDCLHLLTNHEPGNELHLVPEVAIPGGSVDYVLVSASNGKVRDFVAIELQTLDTTGTVWPERQRLLRDLGVARADDAEEMSKSFGMNWKMTAKTILVQMHHKVQTFEHVGKKLVLVVQDKFMDYMSSQFKFDHLSDPAVLGDSMHFHAYALERVDDRALRLQMQSRLSTDVDGISECLGL